MITYFDRIFSLRYFWWTLVRNDFKNRYRNSFLGLAWSLARPIGMTIVLCVVFSGMFERKDGGANQDYPVFLFTGIAVWQFLTETLMLGCTCFVDGSRYLRQQPIPLVVFPLRVVLGSGIHLVIALSIAMTLAAYCVGLPPPSALLSLVPALALLFCLGIGFATLAGLIHTHFTDTRHLLEIVLQALYFLTPVFYKPGIFKDRPRVNFLAVDYNPLYAVLEIVRHPLQTGEWATAWNWGLALAFLGIVIALAVVCLRLLEKNLVFWV
jgi:lipopolysaccharide transport system permease protein